MNSFLHSQEAKMVITYKISGLLYICRILIRFSFLILYLILFHNEQEWTKTQRSQTIDRPFYLSEINQ